MRVSAASSGEITLIATPVPELEAGRRRGLRPDVGVPVVGLADPVRGRVEDDVVGDVAHGLGQLLQRAADGLAHGHQVLGRAAVEMRVVLPGHDQHFVGDGAPEGADHHDPVVGVDHPFGRVLLRLDGGAQEAGPDEPGEAGLLLGQLAGDEGHAEQLAVRVLERGPRLAAGVHDGLGVAEVGLRGVLLEAVAQRRHHQLDLLLAQLPQGGVVLGGEDEDLVDAAGGGLREDRAAVGHHEGLVTLEGRVEVRHDPDQPAAGRAVGLEGGRACPPRCPGRTGRGGRGPSGTQGVRVTNE